MNDQRISREEIQTLRAVCSASRSIFSLKSAELLYIEAAKVEELYRVTGNCAALCFVALQEENMGLIVHPCAAEHAVFIRQGLLRDLIEVAVPGCKADFRGSEIFTGIALFLCRRCSAAGCEKDHCAYEQA